MLSRQMQIHSPWPALSFFVEKKSSFGDVYRIGNNGSFLGMLGNEICRPGDVYKRQDYTLEYVIPKEGTNLWFDSWVIPANARNKENAEKWINFLCRPDIAKMNFEYITYSTPNSAAKALLEERVQNNKAVFPDMDKLTNCEVFEYLGDEADAIYNDMWKEVKSN